VDATSLTNHVPSLVERVRRLNPAKIIVIKTTVNDGADPQANYRSSKAVFGKPGELARAINQRLQASAPRPPADKAPRR
jgi:hypothetical protein